MELTDSARLLLQELGDAASGQDGIDISYLMAVADSHQVSHTDAVALWERGGTWASRYVAALAADPGRMTRMQLSAWVMDIRDGELCDRACQLFSQTRHAYALAPQWCMAPRPFVRRAGYTIIALLARRDIEACDCTFVAYVEMIRSLASDLAPGDAPAAAQALVSIASRSNGLRARVVRLMGDLGGDSVLAQELSSALTG